MRSRTAAFVALALAPLLLFALLPLGSTGKPLQQRIEDARKRVDSAKRREGVLSTDVAAASRRIDVVQGEITVLRGRQSVLQRDLDGKRAQLNRLQDDLRAERARLAALRAKDILTDQEFEAMKAELLSRL